MNKILKDMLNGLIIAIVVILGGIAGAILVEEFDIYNHIKFVNDAGTENIEQTNITNIINNCATLSRIDMKLICVRQQLQPFYQYKIRNDKKDVSYKILLEEGGDCRNWAQLWNYIAIELGLNKQDIRIITNTSAKNRASHRFSLYYNEQGYCLVDQMLVKCTIYNS